MRHPTPLSFGSTPFLHVSRRSSGASYKDIIHLHEGIEFLYVKQGSGQVVVGSSSLRADGGSLYFFQPFQLHKLAITATEEKPYVRSFLVYDPVWLQAYLKPFPRLAQFHRKLWKANWECQALNGLDSSHPLTQLFDRLGELPQPDEAGNGIGDGESQALLLISLLGLLQRHWPYPASHPSALPRELSHTERAMEWIEANYRKPFSLRELAQYLHLSPAYISGLFRKEIGESLSDYVASRRVKEACHLLQAGDLPLAGIVEQLGISNVSYFCQLFKRIMGESPHQFRLRSRS